MHDRLIQTTRGLLPESSLTTREVRSDGDNDIGVAREWYLGGEMVRRDAWVTLLRGLEIDAQEGNING